ncbi:glycosyltransferase family 2 protein [Candidatus Deianiraea vastatrix]|uniref:glycosyltransferase family 2 protein n=1 Tax=Candidatus Deianiraea vastatrix TaxID=2163644 RepID=UPI001CA44AEC|nr:glycosyltransferase family 2 protein [Candidatus Deianiraea vastatrix]
MRRSYQVKISACIVVYNSDFNELCVCIDSFFENGGEYIVLVDSKSSSNIVMKLKNKFYNENRVSVLELSENRGFGYGHNRGFEYLQQNNKIGKFHAIINPDIKMLDGCLANLLDYVAKNDECAICVPKIFNPDLTTQMLNKNNPNVFDMLIRRFLPKFLQNMSYFQNRYNKYIRLDIGYDNICEVPFASGCFYFMRSETFEKLNGFDEDYFLYMEDADLCKRAWNIGKIVFVPSAKVIHIWKRESHKSLKMTWIMIKSMLVYFRKHGFMM